MDVCGSTGICTCGFWIWDKIFTIEEMYNVEFTTKDMLLGMPFLDRFYPHIITKTHWWFTTLCGNRIRAKRVKK